MGKFLALSAVVLTMIITVSVVYKPVADARGRAIELQAQADYQRQMAKIADREASRARKQQVLDAITPDIEIVGRMTTYGLSAAAVLSIIYLAIVVSFSAGKTARQTLAAIGERSEIWARTIRLDRDTRTYGLLLSPDGQWLINPNTELVMGTNQPHASNQQGITGLTQIQVAGVLANAQTAGHAEAAVSIPLVVEQRKDDDNVL